MSQNGFLQVEMLLENAWNGPSTDTKTLQDILKMEIKLTPKYNY